MNATLNTRPSVLLRRVALALGVTAALLAAALMAVGYADIVLYSTLPGIAALVCVPYPSAAT